jgi:chorismate mutase/prephenate dehydratase
MDRAASDPLQAIRDRIDAIDETMHRLLIDRSGVIAELIRIKGTSRPATAFRPDREADMMRRMVMRHEGGLPLVTVEHIWREIITTFTAMQAPFGVAAAPAEDPLLLRDLIRFYFGFSVAVADCPSAEAAVERVQTEGRDVAVVPAEAPGRWWRSLAGADAPKVFAKFPFIELPSRPVQLPAYVIGPPLKDDAAPDIRLLAVPQSERLEAAIRSCGGCVVGRIDGELLVELPVAASVDDLSDQAEASVSATVLGGFAQPIRFVADRLA